MNWTDCYGSLRAWHDGGDPRAAEQALTFIESEIRRRIPAPARRRWPPQQIEDAIQGFLVRLLERPLPDTADDNPAAYIIRSFRNWCIDIERGRKRDPTAPWEDISFAPSVAASPETRLQLQRTLVALEGLSVEDRVAVKMTDAPATLTWDELTWLASQSGLSAEAARDHVLACPPVFELTLLFDPGPPPKDKKERRDRMERFRKRRERARARLRAALGEPS